jgi:Mini-chromosome maintenance replisome factor
MFLFFKIPQQSIPLLDRNLAGSSLQAAVSDKPQMVRIRGGFVQDMFPSEYFETTSTTNSSNDSQNSSSNCRRSPTCALAERTPLLVTPIPFSTPWLRNVLSEKQVEHRNKRVRSSGDSTSAGNKKDNKVVVMNDKKHANSGADDDDECESSSSSSSFWWDAETMKSDPDQVPVLAQFYYDQYDWAASAAQTNHQQEHHVNNNIHDLHNKVRLNDIVEIIGILESQYGDDDIDEDMDMAEGDMNHTNNGIPMDVDEGAFWDEDDTATTTPPRHIPRLHVLWFGCMEFDTIAAQALCKNSIVLSKQKNVDNNTDDNDMASQLLATALEIDQLSATALYLNLLSMAERQPSMYGDGTGTRGIVTKTPSGETLGCSSLHLILPTHESCCRFQQRLESVLSQIVPTINSIHLLGDNKNSLYNKSPLLQLPVKNQGRIQPTLWQLPQGSTLIINTSSSGRNLIHVASTDPSMAQALEMLTMHHHLPYQFDGGVQIPFEADVRVIVLSSADATTDDLPSDRPKFLPCTIQAKCCFHSSSNHAEQADVDDMNSASRRNHRLSEEQATFLRQYLARARGGSSNNNNIGLPGVVLERAQNDFIQRRTAFREREQQHQQGSSGSILDSTQNTTRSSSSSRRRLPDDMDLHRWLTWTRLLARQGRGNTIAVGAGLDNVVATIQDWERALVLDDALTDSVLS